MLKPDLQDAQGTPRSAVKVSRVVVRGESPLVAVLRAVGSPTMSLTPYRPDPNRTTRIICGRSSGQWRGVHLPGRLLQGVRPLFLTAGRGRADLLDPVACRPWFAANRPVCGGCSAAAKVGGILANRQPTRP